MSYWACMQYGEFLVSSRVNFEVKLIKTPPDRLIIGSDDQTLSCHND